MTRDELFDLAHASTDIAEHLGRLRWLASIHDRVTEFGVRQGASTIALLTGNPVVTSFDIEECDNRGNIEQVFPSWHFIQGDTLAIVIDETDLLFIDTDHTFEQLSAELARHHHNVTRTIVLHDTYCQVLDGVNDPAGMWRALDQFLGGHPEWRIVFDEPDCNGLTVLGRML